MIDLQKRIVFLRHTLPVLLMIVAVVTATSGCGRKKGTAGQVIPPGDLVPLLEDIYLADGIFSLRTLRQQMPGTDSMSNYRDILAKYGYTLADMDTTITYYTTDTHMKDLAVIYEQVVSDLRDRVEKAFEEERPHKPAEEDGNLWPLKQEYHLPREGRRNKIPFSVALQGEGVYSLKVRVLLDRKDGSKKPYIHLWYWKKDGSPGGKRIEWAPRKIPQDGRWHQIILAKKLTDPSYTYLKGYLLDDRNKDTLYIKRADIKEIRLERRPLRPEVYKPLVK